MLHPTPAVGGYPKDLALPKISELEPFDRGWYAGPIGWFSKNAAEFAVAIRSGMVYHNKLLLYAGAGIVPGSEPEKEWDELENKISNFMRALNIEE
ncbi:MAG: chorismate-binding protein [Calditrichia bacterium]